VPVNMLKIVVESARGGGATVKRPWFGARLDSVDREKAEALGLDRPTGALVTNVVEKSPASDSGLKRGDVITAVDGQEIGDPDAFGFRFATKGLSGQVSLSVLRAGKKIILPVRLGSAPETRPRDPVTIKTRSPLLGITVMNLSPAVAEELSIDSVSEGVVVSAVADGSNAQQVGFQKGDVLLSINNERPATSKDVERLTKDRQYRWLLQISRGGQVFTQQLFGG
jgi:S1-C subfamily serine protease